MAKPGRVYPQCEPGAAAAMDRHVSRCPPTRSVAAALEHARRTGARVLVIGPRRAVRVDEVARAAAWGLDHRAVGALAQGALPELPVDASEVRARRLLMRGAEMILVRQGGRTVGVIEPEHGMPGWPAFAPRLERQPDRDGEARLWLLRAAGKLGEGMGAPVYAVGGFVRDLLLGRTAPDVDLVVEGNGVELARRLAEEIGGQLLVHPGFGTASLEGATAPDGTRIARVDIASARRERYAQPGALPMVTPAPLPEDLKRRDFAVNAMALTLSPSAFGRVLDPLGGQADLGARRLRPLSPLSFVEDPTRILRAARYAARLGFRLDPSGARALRLALAVPAYPALSGQRLRAELELLAAEPPDRARRGFELMLRWGALALWDRAYRARARRGPGRLRAAARLIAWAQRARIALDPSEVFLIALLLDQPREVASRSLERLAFSGEPLAALRAAVGAAPLAVRLSRGRRRRPSEVAEMLRPYPVATLVGAWLHGDATARRRIQWFLGEARATRPLLSGEEVVALGVPRGPEVGACLGALRRLKLDGRVTTASGERGFVKEWTARRRRELARHKGGTR